MDGRVLAWSSFSRYVTYGQCELLTVTVRVAPDGRVRAQFLLRRVRHHRPGGGHGRNRITSPARLARTATGAAASGRARGRADLLQPADRAE